MNLPFPEVMSTTIKSNLPFFISFVNVSFIIFLVMVFPASGYFWSNIFDEKIFKKIFNQVSNSSNKKWNKILYTERNKLYFYDYGNKRFYQILNNIINEKK